MPLTELDPLVREWFERKFKAPTEPQSLGWPEIQAGHDVLIWAPTGSGKTLAAFLICVDALVKAARQSMLADRTEVVYVSPLKALSNDVHRNLEAPLAEIKALAAEKGVPLQEIRTAVRTGDTQQRERARMRREPPHILVTTPESLYILLTAEGSRRTLATASTVIVDEIHAVAGDKRGSHLALTLARLDALTGSRPQRIGLSATVKPIEEMARFLGPSTRIVRAGERREMELAIEAPRDELGPVASTEMWAEVYDRLAELALENRTTLIFVSTRRLSERVAHHLAGRIGEDLVMPHHGSLSRRTRLSVEEKLKKGALRAVVATASLELGIDIGTVDLVCQIGSPRSLAVAFQRIGRSGHWVGAKSKGRFFPTTRDELIECAALVRGMRSGDLDCFLKPRAPLDILAQQLVAACATGEWKQEDLFALAKSAWSYESLERAAFDAVLEMLSEGITTSRGRSTAYLHHDRINGKVRARRGARIAAITSGGAIPDTTMYNVVAEPDGSTVGTVDEDFAMESMVGDVFILGASSWRVRRVEPGRLRVEDAQGMAPSIPFWRGEAPSRTPELSGHVSGLREQIAQRADAAEFLMRECGLDARGAGQVVDYVQAGRAALGAVPSRRRVIAERFFDESGGMQLVIHAPFGARITRAWGLALRKRFCRSFNVELQAAATDNGIIISLSEQHSFPLEIVFEFLKSNTVEPVLTQALLASPMFAVRWRWNATRALAIPRFAGGRKVPAPLQRMKADDLVAAVFPDQAACAENLSGEIRIPVHPLVNETISNCLHEAMDLDGLGEALAGIESGAIATVAIETPAASPFSHEIVNANPFAFLDDAPLEERRARAVQLRRSAGIELPGAPGMLDPEAIRTVAEEAWPAVRDADELHDALMTLVVLPPAGEWQEHFHSLARDRRVLVYRGFWVPAERADAARLVYEKEDEAAAAQLIGGWLESVGPASSSALAEKLSLPGKLVEAGLARLEAAGQVLRGQFTQSGAAEWCNRRLLARIHRLTMSKLRREIEPVTSSEFVRFLHAWQHAAPGTQLHGADGLMAVIRQLEGYEAPAAAWETQVLARRVAGYAPELLDQLCLSGEVMWARLSPPSGPGVRPNRLTPLAIFPREDAEALLAPIAEPLLSHAACDVKAVLERRGASFFADLQRGSGHLASEVEDALWELIAAGLVTADGFENLRALVDEKRRRGEGRGRLARPRHAAGRWALLDRNATPGVEWFGKVLLRRWGVLCRDVLAREVLAPPWRDLLVVLRRMEMRGEIRGGRFAAALVGEHFALPEAVDLLRAVRRSAPSEPDRPVAPADPLNLSGIVLPGPRISPLALAL
ncbi:MAG: DEAD/DEAH box helicase [Acidobacteria bacterium]|nr:DEAD/DEAH box helicase [Acidobacteriota bacterium]